MSALTVIHIAVSKTRNEVIEFSPQCTPDEIKSAILACADVPESQSDKVVLKLRDSEGCLLPIGPKLEGNVEKTSYQLEVLRDGLDQYEDIAKTIEKVFVNSVAVSPEDVLELKESVAKLKTKIEEMDDVQSESAPRLQEQWKNMKLNPRYATQPKYTLTEETRQYLRLPSFDNWQWDNNEVIGLFEFIFEDLGLIKAFDIDIPTLRRFLMAVKDCYNENPFHNFRHSFCVTQMMYGLLHTTKIVEKLKDVDKLILILSTIGHDLDHPGFNNAYQVNALTDLAIIYNDISPLENHHAAVLFTILSNNNINILAKLPDPMYRDVRKGTIKCILATDMSKHGEIMAAFKKAAEEFNFDDAEHKSLLLQMIMKCADISNEVRPTNVAEPWVEALLNEFFAQSDKEKAEGLPTAPFMDREKVTKPGAQVGFINYVMIPLFDLIAKVLPNMEEPIITPIKESLAYYKGMTA